MEFMVAAKNLSYQRNVLVGSILHFGPATCQSSISVSYRQRLYTDSGEDAGKKNNGWMLPLTTVFLLRAL